MTVLIAVVLGRPWEGHGTGGSLDVCLDIRKSLVLLRIVGTCCFKLVTSDLKLPKDGQQADNEHEDDHYAGTDQEAARDDEREGDSPLSTIMPTIAPLLSPEHESALTTAGAAARTARARSSMIDE